MSRRRGFTLLEVLVALAVLAIGLVGVLEVTAQSQRRLRADQDRAEAWRLAETRLAELSLDPELTTGQSQGAFSGEQQRFEWQQSVESTETDGLLRVRVSVAWGPAQRRQAVELNTCLAPGVVSGEPEPAEAEPPPGTEGEGEAPPAEGGPSTGQPGPGGRPGLPSSNSSSPWPSGPSWSPGSAPSSP